MYKKASTRTGGSNLSGWSTRKQTEPRTTLETVKWTKSWSKIQPERNKKQLEFHPKARLLKRDGNATSKGKSKVVRAKRIWADSQKFEEELYQKLSLIEKSKE
jgi:hypothetical protein